MNKQALIEIFDLYSPSLYKYARRLCGDPILADHIVGDVFAKLLDQLSTGNGPRANLRSYLYETTYHRIIDEARYSKRRAPLEAASLLGKDTHTPLLSMEDQLLYKHVLQILQSKLNNDQRNVIILRFLEEFSLRETAAIMGKTVENVKVIQGRALVKIRKSMDHKELRKSLPAQSVSQVSNALGI